MKRLLSIFLLLSSLNAQAIDVQINKIVMERGEPVLLPNVYTGTFYSFPGVYPPTAVYVHIDGIETGIKIDVRCDDNHSQTTCSVIHMTKIDSHQRPAEFCLSLNSRAIVPESCLQITTPPPPQQSCDAQFSPDVVDLGNVHSEGEYSSTYRSGNTTFSIRCNGPEAYVQFVPSGDIAFYGGAPFEEVEPFPGFETITAQFTDMPEELVFHDPFKINGYWGTNVNIVHQSTGVPIGPRVFNSIVIVNYF
ncbi:hypothetical protein [Pantoea sp. SO10]|uniref:hypothetical protein n=1 Tax=Pantoea sp. SO10 TaxID=2575375 RepID=UPI0010C98A0A|nr:hypothetical protein [Pantoea sp. SO10]QCP59347.1 hypothetical protein FCN45_08160 [Pantoea sp. SO10]